MTRRLTAGCLALALAGCGGGSGSGEGSATEPGASLQQEPATSVRVVKVVREGVQPWLYAQGTARATKREFLTFPSAGRIAYVDPALKVGDPVRKGQVIAYQQPDRPQSELASATASVSRAQTDLAVAEASQREAVANLDLARETFERFKILLTEDSASRQEYDEAEARLASANAGKSKADAQVKAADAQTGAATAQAAQAQVTVSESRIVAPIDGILGRLNIEQGYYFSPQIVQSTSEQGALSTIPVFIIDPSSFEVAVDLPAYAIGSLAVGATVLMTSGEYAAQNGARDREAAPPAETGIDGRVYSITPSIDPEKRTFRVTARTSRGAAALRDGEFVSLWIAGDVAPPAPVVPFDAVRYSEGQPFAFVYDPETGTVVRRVLRLGAQGRGTFSVVEGVAPEELVVTDGRAGLADGDRVRVIDQPRGGSEPR